MIYHPQGQHTNHYNIDTDCMLIEMEYIQYMDTINEDNRSS